MGGEIAQEGVCMRIKERPDADHKEHAHIRHGRKERSRKGNQRLCGVGEELRGCQVRKWLQKKVPRRRE